MNVVLIILIGLATALFIFIKIRKSFKKADCGSCCGSCNKDCNNRNPR